MNFQAQSYVAAKVYEFDEGTENYRITVPLPEELPEELLTHQCVNECDPDDSMINMHLLFAITGQFPDDPNELVGQFVIIPCMRKP